MTVTTRYLDQGGAPGLRLVGADLARLPREVHRRLRPRLRRAGEITLAKARANASWSSRIPASMSLTVSFSKRAPGVTIVASLDQAPHARAFEGIVSETFRHPVFEVSGRDTPWVVQAARPYLRPAAQATGGAVVDEAIAAVDEALAGTGWR